jgi:hypothetical protein
MEEDMAELINLQDADRQLHACAEAVQKIRVGLEHSYGSGALPHDQLMEMLTQTQIALASLTNAFASVLHNNRDGRGTPPARGKLNSMMDRSR